MATQLINIQFHNQSLSAALVEGIPYVAMKPICENIGLQWEGQHQRINRHPILSSTMCMTHIVAEDGKQREMLMLPLDYLNGWLFGVDASRVRAEIKPRLLEYQRECFKVLASHFAPKPNGLKRGRKNQHELLQVTPLELDALVQQRAEKLLEGEVIIKEKECPKYHYPVTDWQPQNRVGNTGWLTFQELMRIPADDRPSARLLRQHRQEGDDIAGAAAEINALYLMVESFYYKIDALRGVFEGLDSRGWNIRFG